MAFAVNRKRFQENYQEKSKLYQGQSGRQGYGGIEQKGRYNSYYCEHYKMNEHTVQKCYKIHGYPSNFRLGKLQEIFNMIKRIKLLKLMVEKWILHLLNISSYYSFWEGRRNRNNLSTNMKN